MTKMSVKYHQAVSNLQQIPGLGSSIAKELIELGIYKSADLRGVNPESLFSKFLEKRAKGDISMLYHFRCAVYYASNDVHELEKLKWWYWKNSA